MNTIPLWPALAIGLSGFIVVGLATTWWLGYSTEVWLTVHILMAFLILGSWLLVQKLRSDISRSGGTRSALAKRLAKTFGSLARRIWLAILVLMIALWVWTAAIIIPPILIQAVVSQTEISGLLSLWILIAILGGRLLIPEAIKRLNPPHV